MAKRNNKPLMKNHESRLIGSTTFPEVNVLMNESNCGHGCGSRCDYSRGHNRGGSNSHPKWGKTKNKLC